VKRKLWKFAQTFAQTSLTVYKTWLNTNLLCFYGSISERANIFLNFNLASMFSGYNA